MTVRLGEQFINWVVGTESTSGHGSWVGSSPRLTAADEGVAYAHIETPRTGFEETAPVVVFAPATLTPATTLLAQARSNGDGQILSLFLGPPGRPAAEGLFIEGFAPADEWVTLTAGPLSAYADVGNYSTATMLSVLSVVSAEGFKVGIAASYFSTSPSFDVSFLGFGGREIPLRIRQRGDGLGMGGPRVRGVGSRQNSPRVRGYV